MFNKIMRNKGIFINSAIVENNVGKIEMYGDVYNTHPVDWWTGEKMDIQCITLDDFKKSLNDVKNCDRIELHLNSYGGDATVGLTIRNLLKSTGKHTTCIIEGIAASAAFTIASGCDEVQVYKGSLLMCHRVMQLCFGYYNNDDLQQIMNGNDAYDNASAEVYADKTGMTVQQCLNLMKKSTWMTGQQAIDYGFADTMLEGNAQVELVNKTTLKVNGVEHKKLNIPDNILEKMDVQNLGGEEMSLMEKFQKHCENFFQNIADKEEENTVENKEDAVEAPATEETDKAPAQEETVETVEAQEEEKIDAPEKTEEAPTVEEIINAERTRIQEIEKISGSIDSDLVKEAKFGNTACDAKELSMRQMQREAEKAKNALGDLSSDNEESKVNEVGSEPPAEDNVDETLERTNAVKVLREKMNKAKGGK